MTSKKYRKFRRSKYKFRTRITKGTRQGKNINRGRIHPGSDKALKDIEKHVGRLLDVHHVEHNIGEWVFCELK